MSLSQIQYFNPEKLIVLNYAKNLVRHNIKNAGERKCTKNALFQALYLHICKKSSNFARDFEKTTNNQLQCTSCLLRRYCLLYY